MSTQQQSVNTSPPTEAKVVDISQPLKLVGSLHDINRVMQACRTRLAFLEQHNAELDQTYTVFVRAPQEGER
jgi:hypothetical protein